MYYCLLVVTKWLESDDPDGYFPEGMQVKETTTLVIREDRAFDVFEKKKIRGIEKMTWGSTACVWMGSFSTQLSRWELVKKYDIVCEWEDIKDWQLNEA
jgi:hypothetical protein